MTELARSRLAMRLWSEEVGADDFDHRLDFFIATRPYWKYGGCSWGDDCESAGGPYLSCQFWDTNKVGSLDCPDYRLVFRG